jgi:ribose/xylose/arabinose/galactoside ABC-type transport system permease subunit
MAHVICGACAGLAGVLVVARVNSSSITQGLNYEMDAMACVAIGGVSMNGGDGNLAKVVLGAIVLGVLLNALNLLGVQANPQLIVRGSVIILAVILDVWNKKAKLKEVAK